MLLQFLIILSKIDVLENTFKTRIFGDVRCDMPPNSTSSLPISYGSFSKITNFLRRVPTFQCLSGWYDGRPCKYVSSTLSSKHKIPPDNPFLKLESSSLACAVFCCHMLIPCHFSEHLSAWMLCHGPHDIPLCEM